MTLEEAPKKKARAKSAVQRTREELKRRGWDSQIVERWNPHARRRVDLFGLFDIVALRPLRDWAVVIEEYPMGSAPDWLMDSTLPPRILGIQVCRGGSGGDVAEHRTKMLANPLLAKWIECGGVAEMWSWSKAGARGKRKTWTLKVEPVRPAKEEANGSV